MRWLSVLLGLCLLGVALLLLGGCGGDGDGGDDGDGDLEVLVGGGGFRPEEEWCPTLRTCLRDIRWDEYTAERAVGIGIGPAPGCDPRVAAQEKLCEQATPIGIELSEPDVACGEAYFTHLVMFDNQFELRQDLGRCDEYTMVAPPTAPTAPTPPAPGSEHIENPTADDYRNPISLWPVLDDQTQLELAILFLENNPTDCGELIEAAEDAPFGVTDWVDRAANEPRLQDDLISQAMLVYCQGEWKNP